MTDLIAAIEGGGTKFRCAVSDEPGAIRAEMTVPTTSPSETLRNVINFIRSQADGLPVAAIGIASFGPLDLRPSSSTFGHITSTPKAGWQNVDLVGFVGEALALDRVALDTDVNAAALGEFVWGAGRDVDSLAYITVGTGIGAGLIIHGRPVHGLVHPEFGHIRVPRDAAVDPFPGCCPAHGDCLEGLASGRALQERWRVPASELPLDHAAWALETHYLALGLATLICTVSPERIVVGGGVSRRFSWRELRTHVQRAMGGYLLAPELGGQIDRFIVPPALGDDAALIGALTMARNLVLADSRAEKSAAT